MKTSTLRPVLPGMTLAAGLLLATLTASAQDSERAGKFYMAADFGASFIQDTKLKSSSFDFASQTLEFDPGVRFNVGIGYHFTDWMAVEAETGMTLNVSESAGAYSSGYSSSSLDYLQIPLMANAVFRLPIRSRWQPFAGVGVGGVATQLGESDFGFGQSDEDFGLAWQVFVGCRYQVSSRVELGLAYRYLGATERDFDGFGIKVEGTHTHSFTASVTLKF